MADALKAEGNKAFAAKNFDEAVDKFSQAIEIDPTNHVFYSNRSGAYASLKQFDKALDDANKTTGIKPDWAKGWGRKGAALHGSGDLPGALNAFEEALKLDSSNAQAKAGLDAVERAIQAETKSPGGGEEEEDPMAGLMGGLGGGGGAGGSNPMGDLLGGLGGMLGGGGGGGGGGLGGLGNIFNDPQMLQKIASNPKTASLLADPTFINKLQRIKQNPSSIAQELSDPRFLQVMGALLGVDMNFGGPGAGEGGSGLGGDEEDIPMPDPRPSSAARAKEPSPEPEPEDEESKAEKKAKEDAEAEKKLGNEKYKKREFDAAIEHYNKAWELHKDITYLTNLGAAKFEKGDYSGAIEACKKAIEEGRLVRTDFKVMAKAFGRIGSAYEKLGDLPSAILNFQNSLTEFRTPDILSKFKAAEKAHLKAEKDAYMSPEEAEKARELGNQKFKDSDWPGAVEAYAEMVKRAPEDPRGYSNRAAALIKLMAFPGAVQDCDEAIKRDKTFIRAYLRKAQALFGMKEYNKCLDVCTEAHEHDADGKNYREIENQQQKALEAQFSARVGETEQQTTERIQKDPDIMAILQDPVMQSILQQAKDNPAALNDHMKNPSIRSKVQKLVAAGVIRTG